MRRSILSASSDILSFLLRARSPCNLVHLGTDLHS